MITFRGFLNPKNTNNQLWQQNNCDVTVEPLSRMIAEKRHITTTLRTYKNFMKIDQVETVL